MVQHNCNNCLVFRPHYAVNLDITFSSPHVLYGVHAYAPKRSEIIPHLILMDVNLDHCYHYCNAATMSKEPDSFYPFFITFTCYCTGYWLC